MARWFGLLELLVALVSTQHWLLLMEEPSLSCQLADCRNLRESRRIV